MDEQGRWAGVALVAVAIASAATAGLGVLRPVHLDDPAARGAIETLTASGALLAAVLMLVQFGHSRRRRDLLLLFALVAVSVTDLAFSAIPAMAGSDAIAPGLAPR